MQAVLIDSKYKVFQVDFENMKAYVNKQDVYKKRNGKTCCVEHHFGKWISFSKEDVSYGMRKHTSYDSSVHGLEEIKSLRPAKYLKLEAKQKIVKKYLEQLSQTAIKTTINNV